jgi:phosphatidylinositol-3-phosphatase
VEIPKSKQLNSRPTITLRPMNLSITRRATRAFGLLLLTSPVNWSLVPAPRPTAAPKVGHVFVIVLENEGFDSTFRAGTLAPYLADTLVKRGAFLRQYYGISHFSLPNYIAMISGIAPTRSTQSDCSRYADFVETGMSPDGQPIGSGCIYAAHVQTLANQLEAKGLTWKAYMEDMGRDSTREESTCGHATIGSLDSTARATPGDQYAAKHDPFVYFHAILDTPSCKRNVVALPALERALRSADETPNFSFISPSLCHDGHDRPCVSGEPGGLVSADAFLEHWVPLITNSPAFRADGLLIITFDEALSIDATACCDEPPGPNVLNAGVNGPGGGRVGAVLLSPFIKPGTVSNVAYNHYSLLRSIEDLFELEHLGYAGRKGLATFGKDVWR